MSFTAALSGFKTEEQALEFIRWYEGGGEQAFYDHLQDRDMSTKNGWSVNVSRKGNSGRYWDVNNNTISVEIK